MSLAELVESNDLAEKTLQYIKQQLASVLQLPVDQVDENAPLEKYGIDSILALELISNLEESFGALPKTLLFEHQTIAELTHYMVRSRRSELLQLFQNEEGRADVVGNSDIVGNSDAAGNGNLLLATDTAIAKRLKRVRKRSSRRRSVQRMSVKPVVDQSTSLAIGIIGVSGRYPQSFDLAAYWDNLQAGRDCITEVPASRWDWRTYYSEDRQQPGKHFSKWGGFIDGVDWFDPIFFNLSPREATIMDPQERLFLSHAWLAMEDAGYTRESLQRQHRDLRLKADNLPSQVGVYAGVMYGEYQLYGITSSLASIANRVSYVLNLHGPSMVVDTMCSSSLTAIHLACQDLRHGITDLAFAGGVNLSVHPNKYLTLSLGQFISSEGHCKSFGEGGDGYVPGEGVGVVVLKRLTEAEASNDHIYGVILGSSLSHGGKTNGYTVPNPKAQRSAIQQALAEAKVDPRQISYVEAHGTGTQLGDPIEIAALSEVFAKSTEEKGFCLLGSSKSNIGHCESAAGIGGLTKVLLQMQHGKIAPSLHSSTLNPYIDFAQTPFIVNQTLTDWDRPVIDGEEIPRIAGVSSFGAGGSNAHIIVRESLAPVVDKAGGRSLNQQFNSHKAEEVTERSYHLSPSIIPLSAKTEPQLNAIARNLLQFLAKYDTDESSQHGPEINLPDIAYTLQVGREEMDKRVGFLVKTLDELVDKLRAYVAGEQSISDCYLGEVQQDKGTLMLFQSDEELQSSLATWIDKKKYAQLLKLWVRGLSIDWYQLNAESKPRRVSLPGYPLAKERYWISDLKSSGTSSSISPDTSSGTSSGITEPQMSDSVVADADAIKTQNQVVNDEVSGGGKNYSAAESQLPSFSATNATISEGRDDVHLYQEYWNDIARDKVVESAQQLSLQTIDRVVYIGQQDELKTALCQHVEQQSKQWQSVGQVQQWLSSIEGPVGKLIEEPVANETEAANQQSFAQRTLIIYRPDATRQRDSIEDIYHLLTGGLTSKGFDVCQLILVGHHHSAYDQSWIGYERSIGLVIPQLLVTILFDAPDTEIVLAHVGTPGVYRYIDQTCQQLSIDSLSCEERLPSLIKDRGTYIVTGGMGGLGWLFAQYLAREYGAQLILLGRTAFSDKHQIKLDELVGMGAVSASYEAIDCCDEADLQRLQSSICTKGNRINGVIHAAGLDSEGPITEIAWQDFNQVLLANIEGSLAVNNVFKDSDWICYFSSSSAILGDFGSCSYAVGKRYQMALASLSSYKESTEETTAKQIAINWPLWQEGGMGVSNTLMASYLKSSGQRWLTEAEGLPVFETLLNNEQQQALVMVGADTRIDEILQRKYRPEFTRNEVNIDSPLHHAANSQERISNGDARLDNSLLSDGSVVADGDMEAGRLWRDELVGMSLEEQVLHDIKLLVEEVLQIPVSRQSDDALFTDFGFDSVSLASFATALSKFYGIELAPSVFFSHSNLAQLGHYFATQHAERLQVLYSAPQIHSRKISSPEKSLESTSRLQQNINSQQEVSNQALVSGAEVNIGMAHGRSMAIAVVGISGRFPGADSGEAFWGLLMNQDDVVREIPASRWGTASVYYDASGQHPSKAYLNRAGLLSQLEMFDPLFFEISPREAAYMPVEERLLLMSAYHGLEDAGLNPRDLSETKVGVFIGMEESQSPMSNNEDNIDLGITTSGAAMISSRLSYCLNFRGPTVATNTACSSSLVALHQACTSLQTGESDLALAGGVSLLLNPLSYVVMSKAGMLSTSGQCQPFSADADGIVCGESVVVVVLKRLAEAVRGGDPIYGVVKGSGINFDGKTNGVTAPNGEAQAALLREVYDRYEIDVERLGYVVAHGTGTKLGDPVEVNALQTVFVERTQRQRYCALTSNKSNLGHTLAASGLVSVVNLLYALKYREIPGSVHCETESNYINWSSSAFYVNKERRPWSVSGEEKRLGAVSSFGRSGTNAHVVIEEYVEAADEGLSVALKQRVPQLLVLSAQTEAQLLRYVESLHAYLSRDETVALDRLLVTYQVGRTAMTHRLALVVRNRTQLLRDLGQVMSMDGGQSLRGVYQGVVDKKRGLSLGDSEEDKEFIARLIDRGALHKLAELWVNGAGIDWSSCYGDQRLRRLSGLPGYPFAERSFALPDIQLGVYADASSHPSSGFIAKHPLLHENSSTLAQQRFSSTLTGDEFFLRDHKILGEKILPGVAYLEMARLAVANAIDYLPEDVVIQLSQVVWSQPITISEVAKQVHISLFNGKEGHINYEVYTDASNREERTLHCQGIAEIKQPVLLESELNGGGTADSADRLDVVEVQSKMQLGTLSSEACYDVFKAFGFDYGPGFQGIQTLSLGENQVLAKLLLPGAVRETQHDYMLHPSLMDSALQACIGLIVDSSLLSDGGISQELLETSALKPMVPFALESLSIVRTCTADMFAWIRYAKGSQPGDTVRKLDIDLYDDVGNICVCLRGFSLRAVEVTNPTETALFQPHWELAPLGDVVDITYDERWVVLCEANRVGGLSHIEKLLNDTRCLALQAEQCDLADRYRHYARELFMQIQHLLQDKSKNTLLVQVVIPRDNMPHALQGLAGMLKTAQHEHARFIGQLISVDGEDNPDELVMKLQDEARSCQAVEIQYSQGQRYVKKWVPIIPSEQKQVSPWRTDGVYVITGGAGGLGLLFADRIATQVDKVTLILTGRSTLTTEQQVRWQFLEEKGARVVYQSVDCSDCSAVQRLVQKAQQQFGDINGIIHSAGVIQDNFIVNKTVEELEAVLAPKVQGLINLDEASQSLALDFFVVFSSVTGALGNVGQADYAVANGFMDQYIAYRQTLVAKGQRQGNSLSVNWPLWRSGGMLIDEATQTLIERKTGMALLETADGLQAFEQALLSGHEQLMVLAGDIAKIKQKLLFPTRKLQHSSANTNQEVAISTGASHTVLRERLLTILTEGVSNLLNVDVEDIDIDDELNEYGFDSISLTEFGSRLNSDYGLELTPTLFFEHSTIASIATHLATEHGAALKERLGFKDEDVQDTASGETDGQVKPAVAVKDMISGRDLIPRRSAPVHLESRRMDAIAVSEVKRSLEPVAVIGMAGRFPMAKSVNEFWHNLVEGKECITEVPSLRWDWRAIYGDPQTEKNKTNIKWGSFIDGVDHFDPLFFGLSPDEAHMMDPQQRLLMLAVWQVIEDAGYSAQALSGSNTAIFVGTANSGYAGSLAQQKNAAVESYTATGFVASIGPNRMSHLLNLHGPSEPVETACSSALVAIHRGVEAIHYSGCEQAIVGGVNVLAVPTGHIAFNKAGVLCQDGHVKAFSAQADGYVRGEGVGMILLKPLSAAEAAGDSIYGLIRSSGENHCGRGSSLTAPNPKAQAALLETVYTKANIDPRSVGYIEAHGTGTALGDAVEIDALKTAFKTLYHQTQPAQQVVSEGNEVHCGLGSVKTNIGHLEMASGMAGIIKLLLQLKHKTLVKSLHCDEVSPYIDLQNSPFYIVQANRPWDAVHDTAGRTLPRRGGVSSFGFGGVNAHVVLEEYLTEEYLDKAPVLSDDTSGASEVLNLLTLSAKSASQLISYVNKVYDYLDTYCDVDLCRLLYTYQVGREAMPYRLAIVVDSRDQLLSSLRAVIDNKFSTSVHRGQADKRNDLGIGETTEGQGFMRQLMSNRNVNQLAKLWVNGVNVDWNDCYEPKTLQRLTGLPTYPFLEDSYWLSVADGVKHHGAELSGERSNQESIPSTDQQHQVRGQDSVAPRFTFTLTDGELEQGLTPREKAILLLRQTIARQVQQPIDEIDTTCGYFELGLDSMGLVQVSQEIQSLLGDIPLASALFEHTTIDALSQYISEHYADIIDRIHVEQVDDTAAAPGDSEALAISTYDAGVGHTFPELKQLNRIERGRPIFWFHGGNGGVQQYYLIAEALSRPFYGIQARGWMTERSPLQGIQAMACYYIQVMKSVQQTGPYDIGGFSLGGLIAYEVTRQLQELGETVSSIVMIDTLDTTGMALIKESQYDAYLSTVNSAFNSTLLGLSMTSSRGELDKNQLTNSLIHRSQLDATLEAPLFLEQLVDVAIAKGLGHSKEKFKEKLLKLVDVRSAYAVDSYDIVPLPRPAEVCCYYFLNKNRHFFGEFAPYVSVDKGELSLDDVDYTSLWQREIPNIELIELDASSHMAMIIDPAVCQLIIDFCVTLYSKDEETCITSEVGLCS